MTYRAIFEEQDYDNISGEDYSSDSSDDDNAAEDFGVLIGSSTEGPRKSTVAELMNSVENIQKSVNQLAAAVAVTKSLENVTPFPDLSIATTSRRTVDIDSLIANKNKKGGFSSIITRSKGNSNATKRRKNSSRRKNQGCCL